MQRETSFFYSLKNKRTARTASVIAGLVLVGGVSLFLFHSQPYQKAGSPPLSANSKIQAAKANIAAPTSTVGQGVISTSTPTLPISNPRSTFSGLGVSVQYDNQDMSKTPIGTKTVGNTIYFGDTAAPDKSGYYLQVFSKAPADSIQTAISKAVLSGYNPADCPISVSTQPLSGYPSNYQTATLNYAANNQAVGVGPKDPSKCPIAYVPVESTNYFLIDTQHPDKLLFFSHGQFASFSWGDHLTIQ